MFARLHHSRAAVVRLVVALALGAGLSIAQSPAAHAYYIAGVYWNHMTNIQYQMASVSSNDYNGFINGMRAWNNSSAPAIFTAGANQLYLYDVNDSSTGYAGYTFPPNGTGGQCNGWLRISYDSVWLNQYYTNNENAQQVQSTAAHELGHVLGLAHNNNTTAVLMYYSLARWNQSGVDTPQQDDINGDSYIYRDC